MFPNGVQKMKDTHNVLMVASPKESDIKELAGFITRSGGSVEVQNDISIALQCIQDKRYQVLLLDADISEIKIESAVRIVKNIDPQVKVIVRTSCNSKQLESNVRKEKIFYYHLNSFGVDELKVALQSALETAGLYINLRNEEGLEMGSGKKIFIVDDDPDFVEINKTYLERENYRVDYAYTAEEAMEKIVSWMPDLIILDVMMPSGTEGFHFAYKLRKDTALKDIPVLMITAINQNSPFTFSSDTDGDYLPVEDFLEKPVNADELLQRVAALLAKSSKHTDELTAH